MGAGNAMGGEIADISIIVKMIRVMTLVPVLLILSWWIAARAKKAQVREPTERKGKWLCHGSPSDSSQ